jgi:EpsI family protein
MDQQSKLGSVRQFGVWVVAVLFGIVYYQTFIKLTHYWWTNDMYSYGYMVAPIAALVVWRKRRELQMLTASPSVGVGLALSTVGLMMLLAGRFSSTNVVEEISLVITICGLTLLLFGRTIFRVLLFPISYLLFMIPVWEVLTSRIHPYFQLYSATVGTEFLKLFGLPVFQEGVFIYLPKITLTVAEACSGVNYLIAVFCLGIPTTYLFVKNWPKRVVIVCAAALIALASNGLRVASVMFFAYYGIRGANGDIHGPLALFRSLLISGVGFVALFALIFRFADTDGTTPDSQRGTEGGTGSRRTSTRGHALGPVVLASILLTSALVAGQIHEGVRVPMDSRFRALPHTIGRWESRGTAKPPIGLDVLNFDDTVSRHYTSSDGAELNLFLGYYARQEQGRELAGSKIRSSLTSQEHGSYVVGDRDGTRVNDFLTDLEGEPSYQTYWYVLNDSVVSDDYEAKLYTAWSSMVHGRTNGAIVLITSVARTEEPLEVTRLRVGDFVAGIVAASRGQSIE